MLLLEGKVIVPALKIFLGDLLEICETLPSGRETSIYKTQFKEMVTVNRIRVLRFKPSDNVEGMEEGVIIVLGKANASAHSD